VRRRCGVTVPLRCACAATLRRAHVTERGAPAAAATEQVQSWRREARSRRRRWRVSLAAALPATLHTLVLGVQRGHGAAVAPAKKAAPGTAAALRALLFAAATRCPGLRSAQLVTSHDNARFVAACRAAVDALAAARPDVRAASYRAYTLRPLATMAARRCTVTD
jgi:hypothetical protein